MTDITNIITYIFLFISLNFEIFFLVTYFENRVQIEKENKVSYNKIKKFFSVTIIVPCWNEENTVNKTVHSLLNLDYPKDKLKIMIVDDGSTDNTWEKIQKFNGNPQVEMYKKENGGKHSALNYGISKLNSDLVGCLDADSYVDKDALLHIVSYFQNNEITSVTPSVKLWKPKGALQLLQKVEYGFGIFTRKMLHYLQAVYITPGPFSIFRTDIFKKLGGYRKAHNTEDIEIALRIQKNGYKIAHAHNALVYTVPPDTLRKLLKQRVRWVYGFIKNAIDYKEMFFKKKYGNVGIFILPMAAFSIVSILFVSLMAVYGVILKIVEAYNKFSTVGFHLNFNNLNFDWFFINTQFMALASLIVTLGSIVMILISRKVSEGKVKLGMDLIYYLTLYMFIAPIWIAKAFFNAIFSIKTTWR